jgi:hypothetical protein
VSVDGGATTTEDQIQIDTSKAGAHTILYSATDQHRLIAYATRTLKVITVQPANDNPASTAAANDSPLAATGASAMSTTK